MTLKIAVVGLGYVGLTTALCFADKGVKVFGYDVNELVKNSLRNSKPHIKENKLKELLENNIGLNFFLLDNLKDTLNLADVIFLCIDTPTSSGKIDLTNLKSCISNFSPLLETVENFKTFIIKSTVVPGTTDKILAPLFQSKTSKKINVDFGVAVCPEFLREGTAVDDFMSPDRVIVGTNCDKSVNGIMALFDLLGPKNSICTTPSTAEMAKYTSNSFFAMLVAFGNEIANIAANIKGVEYDDLFHGLLSDRRIEIDQTLGLKYPDLVQYIYPGIGYGGSCFPKDLEALKDCAIQSGYEPVLIDAIHRQNVKQPAIIADRIMKFVRDSNFKTLGFLGLSFKKNSADLRNSKAIELLKLVAPQFSKTLAHDPIAHREASEIVLDCENIAFHNDLYYVISQVHTLILAVPCSEYEKLAEIVGRINPNIHVIDTRGFLNKNDFKYFDSSFGNCEGMFK